MKLVSLVGLAAALVGLAAPATNAWTITTANATQPEEVLGPHQTFVKVWTVTGASPVGAIELAAAGSVFIDYDANLNGAPATEAPTEAPVTEAPTEAPATEAPTEAPVTETPTEAPATTAPAGSGSDDGAPLDAAVSFAAGSDKAVAKVVLSGNCTKLLDEIEVVAHGDALKIRFKNNDFSGHGYILTEVVVGEKAALAKISSSGSSGVYVSEGVFAANGSAAAITVSGDGDIFVAAPATDFALASLNVKVSGSGNIQFNAGSLAVNESLWTKVSGDATIAVVAKTIKVEDTLNTKISGEGEVYIQADNVQATDLVSKISGDGDITVSTNGSCVSQDISISGTGNVATGSILSENTKLKMSGDGSVLVQTSGTFLVPHEIDGKVQYFGAPPQKITDGREPRPTRPPHPRPPKHHRGWYWGWWDDDSDDDSDEDDEEEDDSRYLPNSVTASPENIFKTYELRAVPAREPTFLVLSINHNRWGSEPNERVVISILGWDIDIGGGPLAAHTQRLAAHIHKQHGPTGVAALGVLSVAAVAAVGVAVHKAVMQRRRRREYQPLLSVVTN